MAIEFVVFAAESIFSVETLETLERFGYTVAAAVITGEPEWDMTPLAGLTHDRAEQPMLSLPTVVPWVTPWRKWQKVTLAQNAGFNSFPSLVDPQAVLARTGSVAAGTYVNAGAIVGGYSELHPFTIVNRASSIGHHTVLEAFASTGPGVTIAARCRIGQGTMIGAGAVVAPGISIGSNCLVTAGAVVLADVPDNARVSGNPAVIVDSEYGGYKGGRVPLSPVPS